MMFGDPETVIAKLFRLLSELDRCAQRICGGAALFDRAFVQETEEVGHKPPIPSLSCKT
jgi:hypothetical protein